MRTTTTSETLTHEKWRVGDDPRAGGLRLGLFPAPSSEKIVKETIGPRRERRLWISKSIYYVPLLEEKEVMPSVWQVRGL